MSRRTGNDTEHKKRTKTSINILIFFANRYRFIRSVKEKAEKQRHDEQGTTPVNKNEPRHI